MKLNKIWLRCAVVRAVRTVAQTAISTIGVSAMISDVNWLAVVSSSALAGILSILTSVSGLPEAEKEGVTTTENKEEKELDK